MVAARLIAECGVAREAASGACPRFSTTTKQLKAGTSTARRRGDHVAGQDDPVGRVPRAGARCRAQKAGPLAVSPLHHELSYPPSYMRWPGVWYRVVPPRSPRLFLAVRGTTCRGLRRESPWLCHHQADVPRWLCAISICLDRCTLREPAGLPCHIAATSVRVMSDVLGIGKGTRCLVFLHGHAAIFDTADSDLSIGLS